ILYSVGLRTNPGSSRSNIQRLLKILLIVLNNNPQKILSPSPFGEGDQGGEVDNPSGDGKRRKYLN
ncbi:MAG TPA: hypothetical protein PK496_10165, partial [Bacteroidales bacterium]|nr:hypothetical protein [Bacteroidales bacterium]